VHPKESETVISQFGRVIFTSPFAWFYHVAQLTTALILVLVANTSFADFPRLASLVLCQKSGSVALVGFYV